MESEQRTKYTYVYVGLGVSIASHRGNDFSAAIFLYSDNVVPLIASFTNGAPGPVRRAMSGPS